MTAPEPYTPEELDRLESLGPLDRPYGRRLIATVRAAWAERDAAVRALAEATNGHMPEGSTLARMTGSYLRRRDADNTRMETAIAAKDAEIARLQRRVELLIGWLAPGSLAWGATSIAEENQRMAQWHAAALSAPGDAE